MQHEPLVNISILMAFFQMINSAGLEDMHLT